LAKPQYYPIVSVRPIATKGIDRPSRDRRPEPVAIHCFFPVSSKIKFETLPDHPATWMERAVPDGFAFGKHISAVLDISHRRPRVLFDHQRTPRQMSELDQLRKIYFLGPS